MDDQRHHPYENIRLNIAGHARYEYTEVARSYVPMHWHGALELIYILSGELTVETEQHRWQLHAGQCIFVSPYVLHSTISLSGSTALLLQIPTEKLGDFAPETRSRQFIWDAEMTNPTMTASIERVKQKLLQMQHTASSDSPFRDIHMASLLLEITYLLYEEFSRPVTEGSFSRREKNRQRLLAVMAYTEAHYRENIALNDAAATLHMHPNSFCRFFKENTGMTYLNYLNEYRLSQVYEDLVTTDVALHEILEKHGFTNYKLFRHMFAERFHTTPGRMREELREGNSSK